MAVDKRARCRESGVDAADPSQWTVADLLRSAADDWEKLAGRFMDQAQKADRNVSEGLRLLAEQYQSKARKARELAAARLEKRYWLIDSQRPGAVNARYSGYHTRILL